MPQKIVNRYKHVIPLSQDDLERLEADRRAIVVVKGQKYVISVADEPHDLIRRPVEVIVNEITLVLGRDIAERLVSGRRTSLSFVSGEYISSNDPIMIAEDFHDVSFVFDSGGMEKETVIVNV